MHTECVHRSNGLYAAYFVSLSIRKLAMGVKKRPAAIKRPAARTREAS